MQTAGTSDLSSEGPLCAMSIDLESWVHRDPDSGWSARSREALDGGYIVEATRNILNLLDDFGSKLTFFVVSEIFEWFPDLIHDIELRGHEVASHTHTHARIETERDLVEQLKLARGFVREFGPVGFRAPQARICRDHFAILSKHGFTYDSSSYGYLSKSTTIHGVREIPISTLGFPDFKDGISFPRDISRELLCQELPMGSGFFMSALSPFSRALPRLLRLQNKVPVLFLHPWQIVPHRTSAVRSSGASRRFAISLYSRSCLGSFVYLLSHFRTMRMRDLASLLSESKGD